MAVYTGYGNTVTDFRLKMTVTTYSGYCIVSVWGQALGYGHSWSATLARYGAWSGNVAVTMQSGWGEYKDVLFSSVQVNGAGTKSFGASISTPFGVSTVEVNNVVIPSAVSAPGPPQNLRFTRNTWISSLIQWDAPTSGGPASGYGLQMAIKGGAFSTHTTGSGRSYTANMAADSLYEWRAYASNAGGNSQYSNTIRMYTQPKTPTKPALRVEADGSVTVTSQSTAFYNSGWEIARGTPENYSIVAVLDGRQDNLEWNDTAPRSPNDRYWVRSYAGADNNLSRAYSAWSEPSETSMAVSYTAPTLSRFEVARCDVNGVLVEFGEYLRIVHSGSVTSVKDAADTELNTRTLTARWRVKGSAAGWTTHTIVNAGTPASWTNAVTIVGPGFSPVQAWDIQLVLSDAWNSLTQQTEIPVAATALSLGTNNVGIGKIVERGTLDVGGDTYIDGVLYGGLVTGKVSIPGKGTAGNTMAVTFPPGAFTTPPLVIATKQADTVAKASVYANAVTKDGCTLGWYTGDGSTITSASIQPIAWIAVPQE